LIRSRQSKFSLRLFFATIAVSLPTFVRGDLAGEQKELPQQSQVLSEELKTYVATGQVAKAKQAVAGLLMGKPDLPHPDIVTANVFFGAGRPVEGQQLLESLATVEPDRFDLRLAFCNRAIIEKRWFDAAMHASAAEKSEIPQNWSDAKQKSAKLELGFLEAVCNEGRSDFAQARDEFRKVFDGSAAAGELRRISAFGFIRCSIREGEFDACEKVCETICAEKLVDNSAQLLMAEYCEREGNAEKAEAYYKMAVAAKDKRTDVARIKYSRWLVWNNRPAQVVEILKDKTSDEALERERQFIAGLVARMEGRQAEAKKILLKLHQQDPTAFAVSNHLALVLADDVDESSRVRATQIAESNARNHQNSSEAWSTLGWIQYRMGDIQRAQESMRIASTKGPATRDAVQYMATILRKAGDSKRATQLEQIAATMSGPKFVSAAPQVPQ
jgi:predicted Zn-dependent protease